MVSIPGVNSKKPFWHICLRLKSREESRGTPSCSLAMVSIPRVALLFCVHHNSRNKKSEETRESKTKERETTKKSKCHPSPSPAGPMTSLRQSVTVSECVPLQSATFCLEFVMEAPKSLVMRMPEKSGKKSSSPHTFKEPSRKGPWEYLHVFP